MTPSDDTPSSSPDHTAVLEANAAFYRAFETADLDAMSDVWEHSDRVSCVHPGWSVLRGWGEVSGSWLAIFTGGRPMQFILTNESVEVVGPVAWVTVDENLLPGDGFTPAGTVTAVNLFVRGGDGWRMVAHHGSPVMGNRAAEA
jgi:ketosteroid isomerase-like protein